MLGCLRTRVCKQPIIALYFESETVLKFYNLKAHVFSEHFPKVANNYSLYLLINWELTPSDNYGVGGCGETVLGNSKFFFLN